ncbi:uncharacterized protein LOC110178489 [Drosophila serrata]|uniref:uncharacterized protein LOC110178489 n=1 Tax=Drosophila serrata TaxID=7274 RepID=UPI000A1D0028|nr:uncharacterized protein LOC110178489 [Drosophila serrata]
MRNLKTFALLAVILGIFACHSLAHLPVAQPDDCPPNNNNHTNGTNGDREDDGHLCANFQHIRDLIDQEKLRTLIQLHYNCDAKFRRAMRYYKTAGFVKVTTELTETDAYQTILRELRASHVDTAEIDNVAEIFYCIVLPVEQPDRECDCKKVKGHTFVNDLLYIMPREEIHDYVAESKENLTNFGNFTIAVTSPAFQATLKASIKKKDVAKPLRTLRRNGWDIPELLRAMLVILNW